MRQHTSDSHQRGLAAESRPVTIGDWQRAFARLAQAKLQELYYSQDSSRLGSRSIEHTEELLLEWCGRCEARVTRHRPEAKT